jgi:choline transporter-like protein 2/4/5
LLAGIIREASEAIRQAPALICFPLVPFVLLLGLVVYWIVAGAYISSMASFSLGDLKSAVSMNSTTSTNSSAVSTMDSNDLTQYFIAYHFFGLLWTNQVIQAISMCTIAGVVCQYYWSRQKEREGCGGLRSIARSFKNCFRYHFGSLVFGALIIAIVQFARAVLAYIDKQTQGLQDKNRLLKLAMKLIQCCMWCLEKFLKFISRNAYILVAMRGGSFCASTREAFSLIFANLAQIAVTASISAFLLLLAKATITFTCGAAMFAIIDNDPSYALNGSNELSSPAVPLIMCVILAWFVASTFMNVYELAIDTILLCFCVDLKDNKEGSYYMSEGA